LRKKVYRKSFEKGFLCIGSFFLAGGAGRDRTDGLMNAILPNGGSLRNITH